MICLMSGDMFDVNADVRVNTVNCIGVMGSGVALAFRERYPEMFKDYQRACRNGEVRPGSLHVWRSLFGDWIVNFPTKRDWRDKSRYEDIASGLDTLRSYLQELGPVAVTLPALGCGHGGLDWTRVSKLITSRLSDLEAKIYLFEPADSREVGIATRNAISDDEHLVLQTLGVSVTVGSGADAGDVASQVLVAGDEHLLHRRWLSILPSQQPDSRELAALTAIAFELGMHAKAVTVSLLYANQNTEKIARLFSENGIAVVLVLPFGPLSKRNVIGLTGIGGAAQTIVSLAHPSEIWSKKLFANSLRLIQKNSTCSLISDPNPIWAKRMMAHASSTQYFYLRYDDVRDTQGPLHGARAIGRNASTSKPNLAPVLDAIDAVG
jgi:O-acetyl-ADP-ribose deacetylase (regulator of RNase III)